MAIPIGADPVVQAVLLQAPGQTEILAVHFWGGGKWTFENRGFRTVLLIELPDAVKGEYTLPLSPEQIRDPYFQHNALFVRHPLVFTLLCAPAWNKEASQKSNLDILRGIFAMFPQKG